MSSLPFESDDPHVSEARIFSENHGVFEVAEHVAEMLDKWKSERITIAVTGDSGAGKSSFIDTIRRLNDHGFRLKDDGMTANAASDVGTTKEPMMYLYPSNNNIQFWELPVIGTPERPTPEDYYGKVKFKDYDVYLILARSHFTDNDKQLAQKVRSLNKPFLFIRTHIDEDLQKESDKPGFDEERTLTVIRGNCLRNLGGLITSDEDLFLVCNRKQEKLLPSYPEEFNRLILAVIRNVLKYRQRESLCFSLTAFSNSSDILKTKAAFLKDRIWKVAAASCAGDVTSIPGLSTNLNVGVLREEVEMYKSQLGIPDENTYEFKRMSPEQQEKIKKFCVTSKEHLENLIAVYTANSAVEGFTRFTSSVGSAFAGGISFSSTYYFLNSCLTDIEETALECLVDNVSIPEDVQEYIEKHGLSRIQEFFRSKLQQWKDVDILIGVTGDAGVGKSSFINAIRKSSRSDGLVARTGIKQTTMKAKAYPHPTNKNIVFWDLPGIGTPEYPDLEAYCEKVQLQKYDTFLICSTDRFTNFDRELAEKVRLMKKSFFFVRTKIDQDVRNQERDNIAEETTINMIREDCVQNLNIDVENVFLISNHETTRWEFARLEEKILDALPQRKKECLTLALELLTTESEDILKRKAKILRGRIWMIASLSGAGALPPVPGLSIGLDAGLLWREVNFYRSQLGLPDEKSDAFKRLNRKNKEKVRKFFVASVAEVGKLVAVYGTTSAVEEVTRYIPIVGTVIASSISFSSTYYFLSSVLYDMEKTAFEILYQNIPDDFDIDH